VTDRDRRLCWPDCFNARDLGGLPTAGGGTTRWGAVVRCDSLDRLTPAGWQALEGHGVRTVIDLRNDIERDAEPYSCDIPVVHVPVEDDADSEFVAEWRPFSTPHYYAAALSRWPERAAAAVRAVARAGAGGVVVHSGMGRDRTGLVTILLLALVGVPPDVIAGDYELSAAAQPPMDVDAFLANPSRVNARTRRQLEDDLEAERRRRAQASDREAILATLAQLDVPAYLRAAGVEERDVAGVRRRLL
jgi:protein tyrosine/serine phosphatase